MKRAFILLIGMAGLLNTVMPFCRADLRSDDIVAIMRASRARYISMEAAMDIKGFYPTQEKQDKPVLMYSQEAIYRTDGTTVYAEYITKAFSETGTLQQHFKEVAVVTPRSKTYYREDIIEAKHRRGRIDKNEDNQLGGWFSITPDVVLWYDLTIPGAEDTRMAFVRNHPDKAALSFDAKTSTYSLETPAWPEPNAPLFRYTIDPSRGFMPVVYEWLDWNKTRIQKYVRGDYRQINGVWAPFRFWIYDSNDTLATEVTVTSLSLNQPVSADTLNFEFPEGTWVSDRILGVDYRVRNTDPNQPSPANTPDSAVGKLAPPAADRELAQNAQKAQELIAREKLTAAASAATIAPVEVTPCYVWVLPDKKAYTLGVKSPARQIPALTDHAFEGNGLILHSCDKTSLASGKITFTLERPKTLTGYADGILTLTFSDQPVVIHFIAAPLSEP